MKGRDHVCIFLFLQGPVRFNKNRERVGTVIIKQYRRGRLNNFLTKQQTDRQTYHDSELESRRAPRRHLLN